MTIIKKAAIFCDCCGARQDIPWNKADSTFSPLVTSGTEFDGWRSVGSDKHLCSDCYPGYEAKKAEQQRELNEMLGIKSIVFDI